MIHLKFKTGSVLLILFVTLISCNNKEVKLPANGVIGIQDTIYNNSTIWMFYAKKGSDTLVEFNRKNKIANTHWIFNIDRRLTLKQILPYIQEMQEKKAKPSLHDNGKITHLYYSYVDTVSHKLSMVQFDSVTYTDTIAKLKINNMKHNVLILSRLKRSLRINNQKIAMDTLGYYIKKQWDSLPLHIQVHLDKNTTYGDYIYLKAVLQQIENDSIQINTTEFVF